ncbi:MAG: FtsX-like permease family protein [Desulfurivibrionaceae bacterium]
MPDRFTFASLAIRNLRRRPLRSTILVAALTLMVAALIFALSFVTRVNASIQLTSARLGADLLVVPTGARGAAEDILVENRIRSFYMDKSLIDQIRKVAGIDKVSHQTYLVSLAGACCSVPESMVVAFDQETDFVVKPWLKNKLGRKLQKGEAIVGDESAFNITLGLVEMEAQLFGNPFKMVGVLDKTGSGLDTAIFISDENIEDIIKNSSAKIKTDQISVIFAKLKKGTDPYKVMSEIENNFVAVDVVMRKDIGKSLLATLGDIRNIFYFTMILSTILSLFLVWAIFTAIANERVREVGIMRALGAKEGHVVKLFLFEVLVLGAIGSIAGILVGTSLSILLAKNFAILKNLPIDISLLNRMIIASAGLLFGTGICIFGALSPLNRLKKLEPLIAIKQE